MVSALGRVGLGRLVVVQNAEAGALPLARVVRWSASVVHEPAALGAATAAVRVDRSVRVDPGPVVRGRAVGGRDVAPSARGLALAATVGFAAPHHHLLLLAKASCPRFGGYQSLTGLSIIIPHKSREREG